MNIPKITNAASFKGRMSTYAPITIRDAKDNHKIENCQEVQAKELGKGVRDHREIKIDSKQITSLSDDGFKFKTEDGKYNVNVYFNQKHYPDMQKQQYCAQMMTLANQYDKDDNFSCLLNLCG